jgi:hypothetical protein
MKKLITLFIVLSILVPAAFAQDEGTFTWGGQVRADYEITETTSGLIDGGKLELTGTYAKGPFSIIGTIWDEGVLDTNAAVALGPKPRLALEFVAAGDNYKVDFKTSQSATFISAFNFWDIFDFDTINTLYGYGFAFDKQLRVDLSYVGGDALWGTPGPLGVNVDPIGNGGVRFAYAPDFLKGFSAGIYLPNPTAAGLNGIADWLQAGTGIGAKYVTPDTTPADRLTIAAGIKFTNTVDTIIAGAKFLISPELYVNGDISAGIAAKTYSFALGGEYAKAPLTIGGTFKLNELGEGGKTTANLAIAPYVQYIIVENVLLSKLSITLTQGLQDNVKSELVINPIISIGYKGGVAAGIGDFSGFQVGYKLTWDLKAKDAANSIYAGFHHAF